MNWYDQQHTLFCPWCGADDGCDCTERMACDEAGEIGHWSCGMVWDSLTLQFVPTFVAEVIDHELGARYTLRFINEFV